MQKIVVLLVLAGFIFGGWACSQPPIKPLEPVKPVSADQPNELQAKIEGLIKQLGADDWQVREEATEELIKIGEPVISRLEKASKEVKDPEVKNRCNLIITEINKLRILPQDPNGNFFLYISNQSSINQVDIKIFIDGRLAVESHFEFNKGHTWVKHQFRLTKGTHKLRAESVKGSATLDREFVIEDKHCAVINYWYAINEPNKFGFDIHKGEDMGPIK